MHFDKRKRWHPDCRHSSFNVVMLRYPPNKVAGGKRYQMLRGVMVTKCPTTKKKGRNPHLMKHWGHAARHGRYNPHPVSWASSTEFILYSQDQESIVSLGEITKQPHNVQLCNFTSDSFTTWSLTSFSTCFRKDSEALWWSVIVTPASCKTN